VWYDGQPSVISVFWNLQGQNQESSMIASEALAAGNLQGPSACMISVFWNLQGQNQESSMIASEAAAGNLQGPSACLPRRVNIFDLLSQELSAL